MVIKANIFGYSFLNILDPRAGGAMVEAIQANGKPTWLDQIRTRFLHPTSESFAAYANTILGEDDEDDVDGTTDPTREEVIVLSSEGSDRSLEGLTPHSARAGPEQGAVNEPKKKLDKAEKREKRVEENVAEVSRKRPSIPPFLDYVVVSDTLSGLDAGCKRTERDPEDDETLTEIMKKRKVLDDKKKELDDRAVAALAAKRAKLQKENPPAPSESEIDMGVFSAKPGNLLEEIYAASDSRGVKAGKGPRRIDISKITPPASPPSRTFNLSPPPVMTWVIRGNKMMWRLSVLVKEIVREWKLMGEETLEFENAKRAFAEEREKFNAEKKGLLWRVSDAEQKLVKEKQVNVDKQKDWESACERTNLELQSQREAIVRLSGEKAKISDEAEEERAAHQRREREYVERIAKLEASIAEKVAENKASEILAEEMSRAVPLIAERIAKSDELVKYMFDLGQAAYNSGRKDGYGEGRAAASNNEKDYHFELFKEECTGKYAAKRRDYEFVEFGIVKVVDKLSRRANAIEVLKKALGDSGTEGGAGPSHQD
ncbi:hypothetical protein HanPSC8_Chr11g0485271 [Helianthus annuus]|nr:hypothetical protein HanPSC8_Chr11g0485271 [Helianthus annuus]